MPEEKEKHHTLVMSDCRKAGVGGVLDVESFDDGCVVMTTTCGILTFEGEGLHIARLDLVSGECDVVGLITGMYYSQPREKLGFGKKNRGR